VIHALDGYGNRHLFSRPTGALRYYFSLLVGWLVQALNFYTTDLGRPLTDHHEICTQVWYGVTGSKPENLHAISFTPPLKHLAGKNP